MIQANSLNILVAEDNEENRLVTELLLRRMGYRPLVVNDGTEAWSALQAENFDFAILDLRMPGIDGLTLARRVKVEMPVAPKLVALSASAFDSDRSLCAEAGFAEFLSKPLRESDLRRIFQGGESRETLTQAAKEVWNSKNLTAFVMMCGAQAESMIERILDDTASWLDSSIPQPPDEQVAARAHQLAGTVLLIGAADLGEALIIVEAAALTGRTELEGAIEAAKQAYDRTQRELPNRLNPVGPETARPPHP